MCIPTSFITFGIFFYSIDNLTCYHVTIKTGDIPDASTDANVWMVLYGAEGDTGILLKNIIGRQCNLNPII